MNILKKTLLGSGITIAGGLGWKLYNQNNRISNEHSPKTYTYSEIEKHNTKKTGIWVTHKDSVYNITDFVDIHPGGCDKIMLAAGKSVEPYWNIYKQHSNNKDLMNTILPDLKIGTISDYDPNKYKNYTDPYIHDPIRNPNLIYHGTSPCNAEVPCDFLTLDWITPNDMWYIRNHHPVPKIDINTYSLEIMSSDSQSIRTLNMKSIESMPTKKIISTMQCGGNRRGGFTKKTMGTQWGIGAISTAKWEGVLLRDLLKDHPDIINGKAKHVHFEGIDGVKASIPIQKAMDPYGDVLLAYKMNGETLPKDHGFPIRVIVPGYVGIRNVKWLKSIKCSEEEVDGTWQQGISYKGFPHYIGEVSPDLILQTKPIYEMPIQSAISDISNDDKYMYVKGFAWSGGGRGINRVDVSIDNGKSWKMADLHEGKEQNVNQAWAWTFWNTKIKIPDNCKDTTVICKAIDSSYNSQPENIKFAWNIRGLNNNSWYKKKYNIQKLDTEIGPEYYH